MKILSLFDGMACGALAMQAAGIEIDKYIAYEVDKYAIQTAQHNFPFIEERGDVFKADFTEYAGFDYLIGGSPCTYWSIAQTKNRETVASGMGWDLFSQYVRALHEAKPRFFLYENNKSMSAAIRASITETFGFEPILINSALVSAQNRQRLYWCGIRQEDGTYRKADIQQPADRGILLKDILETGAASDSFKKANPRMGVAEPVCVAQRGRYDESGKVHQHYEAQPTGKTNNLTTVSKDNLIAEPIKLGEIGKGGQGNWVYSIDGKAVAQTAQSGGMGSNTGLYAEPVCLRYERTEQAKKLRKQYESHEIKHGYHELSELHPRPDGKTNTLSTVQKDNMIMEPLKTESIDAPIYEVKDGYITVKGNKYPIKLVDGFYIIRKLTVRECMRLQTVPEWYEWPVSKSQAYKMLGNGWTVEVIAHLLRGLK